MEPTETHPDRLIDFWEWLVENRTKVIVAIIVTVGVVLMIFTHRLDAQLAEEESGEDVLAAMDNRFTTEEVNANAAASDRFAEVASKHAGTAGASNAKFLQASALFDEGKFKEADAAFSAYAAANPLAALRAAAALGQAASKAALNDPGAAEVYKAVREQHPGTPEAIQATLALGRIAMAAKDEAKARELFTTVSTNRLSQFWASIASDLLNQLSPEESQ